jgi:uncharacterized protein YecA (UPF0149 family)
MKNQVILIGDPLIADQLSKLGQLSDSIQVVNKETHQIFSEYATQFDELNLEAAYHLEDLTPPLPKRFRGLEVKPVRDSKTNPKQGRNDLCLCESGKKYKNCCIKNK